MQHPVLGQGGLQLKLHAVRAPLSKNKWACLRSLRTIVINLTKKSLFTQPTDVGTSVEFLFGLNIRHGAPRTPPASSAPAKPLDPRSRGELM